jgi:SAM-dependent methyltransferase
MGRFDMKADWDSRARENALFAVACGDGRDEAAFQESACRDLRMLLEGVEPLLTGHRRALEIGCGVGRLLEPLSTRFCQLYGVDVSGEMVRLGSKRLAHLPNIHLLEVDGNGSMPFLDEAFDFCFSYITFHHIPQKSVVCNYIIEAFRVLHEGAIFRFQLFGRPEGVLQWIRERLTRKSTWRGCKFTLREITKTTERAGFEIVEERYVRPPGERRPRFFGKTRPHVIWMTARKPDRQLSGENP